MAYIDSFTIRLPTGDKNISYVVNEEQVFSSGVFENGNIFTFTEQYLGFTQMGGSQIFEAVKAAYPDKLGTYSDAYIPILRDDGTIDPNRRIYVGFSYQYQDTIPDFASWYELTLRSAEGLITIPGNQMINGYAMGSKVNTIQITLQCRSSAGLSYDSCRSLWNIMDLRNISGAVVKYKDTGGSIRTLGYNYVWPVDTKCWAQCLSIVTKGDNGNFRQVGWNWRGVQNVFAPSYPRQIDAYVYYASGSTPAPGRSANPDFTFINGNKAFGYSESSSDYVPPIGLTQIYVTGGGGGSGGGTSNPGGGLDGSIGTGGTGQTDTGNLQGVDPEVTGGGIVTVDPDGNYDDTFGGGIAQIGSGVSGGYLIMAMTLSQTANLFNRMFSNSFLDGIKDYIFNFFGSVKDAIISANIFPFTVSAGVQQHIYIGGADTGAVGAPVSSQFVNINLGSVKIPKYWDNFLDWSRTSVSIMVPFVGWVPLETTDVMGRTIALRYNVDVVTGQFAAILNVSDGAGLNVDMYQWSGTMAMSIPIASNSVFDPSIISSLFALGGAMVGGGAAPVLAAQTVSSVNVKNFEGDQVAEGSSRTMSYRTPSTPNPLVSLGSALSQPSGSRSGGGGATGSAGLLAPLVPAVRIDRPIQALPDNYGDLIGYPSNIYSTFDGLVGYTEIQSWSPEFTGYTDGEIAELDNLLRGGVYL